MTKFDFIAVPLALIIFVLFRLFQDKDLRSFPDQKPVHGLFQRERYRGSSLHDLLVLIGAFIGVQLIIWIINWLKS